MRAWLAEQLLARVMEYSARDLVEVRAELQAFASLKYDDYEQYWPGQRFIERLALWLEQFGADQKRDAMEFVLRRLYFHSRQEMHHLVTMAFPDHIKPRIMASVADRLGLPRFNVGAIAKSKEYAVDLRSSLFLGLSDGAHVDVFRRANPQLSNEQVWLTYDISPEKAADLGKKLRGDLEGLLGRAPLDSEAFFKHVFLLDDFSGSGASYIREKDGEIRGKIRRVADNLADVLRGVVSPAASVTIVLYLATERACSRIQSLMPRIPSFSTAGLTVVQQLPESFCVDPIKDAAFYSVVENDKYYDQECYDAHSEVGETEDVKLGFAGVGLPLVLAHNTPNNSLFLLWSFSETVLGLFPRVSRH